MGNKRDDDDSGTTLTIVGNFVNQYLAVQSIRK